jgi:hypothetical protein
MTKPDDKRPRYWWIQKSRDHNLPLRTNGAVFQEHKPTLLDALGAEWIKVIDAEAYAKLQSELAEVTKERDNWISSHTNMAKAKCLFENKYERILDDRNSLRAQLEETVAIAERMAGALEWIDKSEGPLLGSGKHALYEWNEFKAANEGGGE